MRRLFVATTVALITCSLSSFASARLPRPTTSSRSQKASGPSAATAHRSARSEDHAMGGIAKGSAPQAREEHATPSEARASSTDSPSPEPPTTLVPVGSSSSPAADRPALAQPSPGSATGRVNFVIVPGLLFENAGLAHLELAVDGRVGTYFTSHFGVFGGLRGSLGMSLGSGVLGLQLPVLAEYAFDAPDRGLYATGGLGLLTVRRFSGYYVDGSLTLISPVDFKLGGGYRLPNIVGKGSGSAALDIGVLFDVGYYAIGTLSGLGRSASVAPQLVHETLALNVGLHW